MRREERYTVIKNRDVSRYLSFTEAATLVDLCKKINQERIVDGRGEIKCVVVEHDWPEYEPVWVMLEQRIDAHKESIYRGDEPRFTNVYCSNCGQEFGPGDHGFSHCENHAHLVGRR